MITTIKDSLNLWGFAPAKLPVKLGLAPHNAPKILANSIPKSGTHLLERLLYLLPCISRQFARTFHVQEAVPFERRCARLKQGQFLVCHLYFQEEYLRILEDHDIKPVFLIRDPRDVLLSYINYITRINLKHPLHRHFAHHLKSDKERLHFCMRGSQQPHHDTIAEMLGKFYPWTRSAQVLTVRFRDLIGEAGGGSARVQRRTVDSILNFIGVNLEEKKKGALISQIYHPRSKTFHRGQIDQWKKRYDDEDIKIFKDIAGDWLIKYGYETGYDW